tara:strand:+ start:339 stop:1319 length:981 start_codon:yes stop_codon:yes gene_type:complete
MKFSLKPKEKLTKDYVRRFVTDNQIFEYYTGAPVNSERFCSPLRVDKNPTCSYFLTSERKVLMMKDFGTGWSGNCFDLVSSLYPQIEFWEVLRVIARDLGVPYDETPIEEMPKSKKRRNLKQVSKAENKTIILFDERSWNQRDIAYWNSYGVRQEVLTYFNIFPVERAWVNGKMIYSKTEEDPCYAYVFSEIDVKLYFPKRKKQWRFINNSQALQGYKQLPQSGERLLVTKSLKDVALLYDYSVPAVAPQAESSIITEEEYKDLKSRFKTILSLYDPDEAGLKGAKRMEDAYGIPIRNLSFTSSKDITDLYRDGGDVSLALKTIFK